MKPTFIGAGVQKCATSWLHEVLNNHPEVYSSDPKEIDFFTSFYNRGYEWYERRFEAGAAAIARGETSPSYFSDPAAPGRIRAYDSDLRIIIIFRDPVDRAFSNHLHEIRKGHFTKSLAFEDGLQNNPCYLEQSCYATNLRRWFDQFPREQVLCLIFEEIAASPEAAMRTVYRFLGVREDAGAVLAGRRSNESVAFRNEGLQAILQRGGHALRRMGFGEPLERVKTLSAVKRLMDLNKKDLRLAVPPMSRETRARLAGELADEMRELATMLGREELPWRSWPRSEVMLDGLRPRSPADGIMDPAPS